VFAPGAAFDRCNLRMIQTQVQPPYHFPKRTRTVILVDQFLASIVRNRICLRSMETSRGMGDVTGFFTLAVYRRSSIPQYCYGVPRSISSQLPVPAFCPFLPFYRAN
jgi:hypothetical protein